MEFAYVYNEISGILYEIGKLERDDSRYEGEPPEAENYIIDLVPCDGLTKALLGREFSKVRERFYITENLGAGAHNRIHEAGDKVRNLVRAIWTGSVLVVPATRQRRA